MGVIQVTYLTGDTMHHPN
uniref:Uncharacterized protein n=1 Tax=Anguilla anguilla TaxID=7936 RepID=A0A0E9S5P2_ANGAN